MMCLLSYSRAHRVQRAKYIMKKARSICSLGASRSLFETAKSNAGRTISKPDFNRRSWLARFKFRATGSRCEPGKCSSVEITAHFHYERPFSQGRYVGHPERSEGPHTGFFYHSQNTA